MTRCFECRTEVEGERFVCDSCLKRKVDQRTYADAVDKLRGLHGHRGVGGAKVHLSAAERKSIERQIGVPVEDAQDARQKMRERGFRFYERGEIGTEILDAHMNGEKSPHQFPGWDKLGLMPSPNKFDFEGRYAHHKRLYDRAMAERE